MNTKKTLKTLLAGAVAVTALGGIAATAHAIEEGQEKCYGVVKHGMNGCAAADKSHGCAGQATEDASGVEWIALPTGTCEKLAHGSLEPVTADDHHGEDAGHADDHGDGHH